MVNNRKHRALNVWAKSKGISLPVSCESLITMRRREQAQVRREASYRKG